LYAVINYTKKSGLCTDDDLQPPAAIVIRQSIDLLVVSGPAVIAPAPGGNHVGLIQELYKKSQPSDFTCKYLSPKKVRVIGRMWRSIIRLHCAQPSHLHTIGCLRAAFDL
jgi:hypothetical protein